MKNYLLIFSLLIALFLPTFIASAGGGSSGGGGKKDSPPSLDCAVRETTATITLEFPASYSGRTHPIIPTHHSDPNFAIGERTLFRARLKSTFYCTVTVTGGKCSDYKRTLWWNVRSRTMEIKVPTFTSYTIRVNFYERCGTVDSNVQGYGNPYYNFNKFYTQERTSYIANLEYFFTLEC